jgi:hypothetical protein
MACGAAYLQAEFDWGQDMLHLVSKTATTSDPALSCWLLPTLCVQVVQRYVDPYQRTTAMVITPTVVKEVRAQFGCNTLPGAALENEGGQGSANAHWEYRWFQVGKADG